MREEGDNDVPVAGEVYTWMEEGIMESPCDVDIRASEVLANYHRFGGRVRYIGGDENVADPVDTVGIPLLSRHLAPGVVGDSCLSVLPHRDLVWEDFSNFLRGTCARRRRWRIRTRRFMGNSRSSFSVRRNKGK